MKRKQFPTSKSMAIKLKRHRHFCKIMQRATNGINNAISGLIEKAFKQVAERINEKQTDIFKTEFGMGFNEAWEEWKNKRLIDCTKETDA